MINALQKRETESPAGQLPPGFQFAGEIMTPEYEQEVIACIEALELSPVAQNGPGQRAIRAFGWGYDPRTYDLVPADPLPAELEPLRHVAAEFAGVEPEKLAHCMVSRFEAGAGIPWLLMRPIWQRIVGITLGNAIPIRFSREGDGSDEAAAFSLPPRSMYLLDGEARHHYHHSFPPTRQVRWALWFRDLSEEGAAAVRSG